MKNLERFWGIEIAHRGLHNEKIPENSLLAFRQCIEKRKAIELDIHLTKDEKLVVFHDNNLKRMANHNRKIKNCTLRELKSLKLKNTEERIPQLEEVLNLVNGKVLLVIEVKGGSPIHKIGTELVSLLDSYSGDFFIQSFDPRMIWWLKHHRPNYIRGLLVDAGQKEKNWKKQWMQKMYFNFLIQPDFISYNIKGLPNQKIAKLKEKGILILTWVVRTLEEKQRANQYADVSIFETKKLL